MNTKKRLIASLLAMAMCFTMLVGSTFAWFTDNASTGVNTIQSGKLDVTLQMLEDSEWVDAEGKTLGFVDEEGNILTDILWEPGCSYMLQPFKIVNKGNLALKFDIVINGFIGDAKLAEAIEYGLQLGPVDNLGFVSMGVLSDFDSLFDGIKDTVLNPGEDMDTSEDGVTLHMKESAGNEYQGLTLSGMSITVLATQAPVEEDSFGNTYDENAEYAYSEYNVQNIVDLASVMAVDPDKEVETALAEAFKSADESGEVTAIVLPETDGDIVIDSDSVPVGTGKVVMDLNGQTLKVEGTGSAATDRLFYTEVGADLVITGNGTIDFGDSISSIAVGGYGNITIENGTFVRNKYDNADEFYPLIENTKNASAGSKLVINGGYFDSGFYALKEDGTPDCFNNCRQLINSTWSNCDIVVYGGTFVGANPAWGDEGMAHLCTICGGNTYCQQLFLEGQNREDTELPEGYTITEDALEDGRPVFTVSYNK